MKRIIKTNLYFSQTGSQKEMSTQGWDQITTISEEVASSVSGGVSSGTLPGYEPAWSPSLQNLLDQPPASLPYRFLLGGAIFCIAFGSWAWFGQIQEVGTAQGRLIPQGQTYKVQPTNVGQITEVMVKEGEQVTAGQILAQLDPEEAEAEINRLEQTLVAYQREWQEKQELREKVHLDALTRTEMANADIQAQEIAIASMVEKAASNRQLLDLLASGVASHQERITRLQPLQEVGAISQEYIFQAEQSLQESNLNVLNTQEQLNTTLRETERLQSELTQRQAQKNQIQLEAQQQIQQLEVEMIQLQAKMSDTQSIIESSQSNLQRSFLKSPVDGRVLSLDLQNTGEVIQPGHTIAEITPDNAPLILSAMIPSNEAGFIETDMPVQVKFDAYPYQDYGVMSGKVTFISANSKSEENLGTFYEVEIALERDHIMGAERMIPLQAGQTAQADIIIRRRRIIEMILDPIKKLQQGGLNL